MNKYIYFCTRCSFKRVIANSKDLEDFTFVKSSPIQSVIPAIDYSSGAVRPSKNIPQPKILKCPRCGFSNRTRMLKKEENDKEDDQTSYTDGR